MTGWQPISTVPQDGRKVWAMLRNCEVIATAQPMAYGCTHWRPMLAAPEIAATVEREHE